MLANEVEFVFSNHLFSPERDQLGWKTFGRRQTPPLHSQIVVLADSPIQKLAQLANEQVAFPGPEALVAYKMAYAQLLNRNIPVQVVFGGNMDGAFAQLASGKAKAVGANSQLTEGWSKREGKPVSFPVNGVIEGWAKILPLMKVGSRWEVFLPPEQAYGSSPRSPVGPNQAVIFDVKLVELPK